MRADVSRNHNRDHLYQHNLMRSVSGHSKMVMRCSFQLVCLVSLTKLDMQSQVHVYICFGHAYWQDSEQGKDGILGTGEECAVSMSAALPDT